jgi:hypothetical protein
MGDPEAYRAGWHDHAKISLVYAPVTYAAIYPWLVTIGREHGYAIALHGSLVKDMDVIAIPWTDEASSAEDLVEAIITATGVEVREESDPAEKPHGRLVWTMHLASASYIDFGVMPRATLPETGGNPT